MENIQDVNGSSSPVASESVIPQTQQSVAPVVTTEPPVTQPKGSQTPSENLYAALAEERRLRKEAEDKLTNINTTIPSDEAYSDEGRVLKTQISTLEEKISRIEEEKNLEKLYNQYPLLREKSAEFSEFRMTEHPRAKIESVAKLYLVENGLLEPKRVGLEKPTGGTKTPPTSGMAVEDIKRLRETNFKKYQDMILKGQIKIEN